MNALVVDDEELIQFDPEVVAAFLRIPPVAWAELRAHAARARRKPVESCAAAGVTNLSAARRTLRETALLLTA